MASLTKAELVTQIDFERRETNAKFVSAAQTLSLLNRAKDRVLREPGIRTIPETQSITAVDGTSSYALNAAFKEVISLVAGSGGTNPLRFHYKPVDEYEEIVSGYCYTFKTHGYIEIKFPDANTLPSTTLSLNFWSKNIVLDDDGTTKKRVWVNDDDTSLLGEEFDEFYIEWVVARILRREGKKEWKDREATAIEVLNMLKETPGAKTRRTRRSFGHFMRGD